MARPPLPPFRTETAARTPARRSPWTERLDFEEPTASSMTTYASDIAFTGSVKAFQQRKGSRKSYARMEENGSWATTITPDLAAFIATQTSVFLATANADGQPYIQHRGGPAGFLRVLDDKMIAFVDYAGNRQYITSGNLADNPKAYLFLIDYAHRRRIRIWGTAQVVEGDDGLTAKLIAGGLQGAARAGRSVHRRCVGLELPPAYPTALRSGRCREGDCRA